MPSSTPDESLNSVLIKQLYEMTVPDGAGEATAQVVAGQPTFHRLVGVNLDPSMEIDQRKHALQQGMQRFLSGLASLSSRVILRIHAVQGGQIALEIAVQHDRHGDLLTGVLDGFLQGVSVTEPAEDYPRIKYAGYVTGIPGVTGEHLSDQLPPLDFLDNIISGILGEAFNLTIVADMVPRAVLRKAEQIIWGELDETAKRRSISHQESLQRSFTKTSSSTEGSTEGSGGGLPMIAGYGLPVNNSTTTSTQHSTTDADSKAETEGYTFTLESAGSRSVYEQLQRDAQRIRQAALDGGWTVHILFGAEKAPVVDKMGALITGALVGEGIAPRALNWHLSSKVLPWLGQPGQISGWDANDDLLHHPQSIFYTSRELSELISPPIHEYPGYRIIPLPEFSAQVDQTGVALGDVCFQGKPLAGVSAGFRPEQLVTHGLVVGMTGSGKTNTLFRILREVAVPFMVIEPVKTEYRGLLSSFPTLRVYTLGDERISPLRLNPFWFPYGFALQHHLDSLKALFSACFTMYASMPNILEQCLYNIYTRKGWSLQHSTNVYADSGEIGMEYYPTLTDLYEEIDDYLTTSGYAEEQKQNLRSALLTRLKSLMTGGKGLLLDTTDMTPFTELFDQPVVMELDGIPDDDEKALVIGLLLIRIYENLKMAQRHESEGLRHLLVIEEAHRVFKNVVESNNPEIANPLGKMVEMFSNMMAEIRAYGQGILIVEQVPSKLAPDAVKNTGMKIVHRLVSRDDCEYMSTALGITPEEAQYCSHLKRGEALYFGEGMHRPTLIRVALAKTQMQLPDPHQLRKAAEQYNYQLLRSEGKYPLVEVVLQDPFAMGVAKGIATKLAMSLMYDDAERFFPAVTEAQQQTILAIAASGYDIPIESEISFATGMLRSSLAHIVRENPFIVKNLRVKTFIATYLDRALTFAGQPFEQDEKALRQLETTRNVILHPMLMHAYKAAMANNAIFRPFVSLMPPHPVDGDAALIMERWGVQGLVGNLPAEKTDLEGLVVSVGSGIIKEFIIRPTNLKPAAWLTAKVILRLMADRNIPDLPIQLNNILNLIPDQDSVAVGNTRDSS